MNIATFVAIISRAGTNETRSYFLPGREFPFKRYLRSIPGAAVNTRTDDFKNDIVTFPLACAEALSGWLTPLAGSGSLSPLLPAPSARSPSSHEMRDIPPNVLSIKAGVART